jgi:hypothetical protein
MADDRPDVKCICRALPGAPHKQGCRLREPSDRWVVPKSDIGTEIKLSHEFLTGMLRAAGGTLTWDDADMIRTLDSRIEMMRYTDPNRYVIRLVEPE